MDVIAERRVSGRRRRLEPARSLPTGDPGFVSAPDCHLPGGTGGRITSRPMQPR